MIRGRFEKQLEGLRSEILGMGELVGQELDLALTSLDTLDTDKAQKVHDLDVEVNTMRFAIEEKCFGLIVTQQPAAGDLRAIVAVMNMIVDLERMGDQTKGIAKIVQRMHNLEHASLPDELHQMGNAVRSMLQQSMKAYSNDNVELARLVASQDDEVDALYDRLFTNIMERMAATKRGDRVEAEYEVLRAARELERFGDLATNIAERIVYRLTGQLKEINLDG